MQEFEEAKKVRFDISGLAVNEAAADSDADVIDEQAGNDVNLGVEINVERVNEVRDEAVNFLIKEHKYEKCDYDECMNNTGQLVTSVRWIDTYKGSNENPDWRRET